MNVVAKAFCISIRDLEDSHDPGTVGRWFELGDGEADDKPHQIFASAKLGLKVDVDEQGTVQSSAI